MTMMGGTLSPEEQRRRQATAAAAKARQDEQQDTGAGLKKTAKKSAADIISKSPDTMGVNRESFQIGDKYTSAMDAEARAQQARMAAQATGAVAATGPQDEARARQNALMDMLQQSASGQGPSVADMQAQRDFQRARAAQLSEVAGASPAARAAMSRMASTNIAQAAGDISGQAQMARVAEQQQARQLLGQTAGQTRDQDLNLSLQQAGLDQQTILANLQSEQGQRALNDQMTQFYMSQGFTRDQAQMQANAQMEQLIANQVGGAMTGAFQPKPQGAGMQLLGAGLGAAATLGAAAITKSDRRAKKKIKHESVKIDELLSKINAYSYDYKDERDGKGRQLGVMAQDLEKSELGRSLVVPHPRGGKGIDTTRGFGLVLAAVKRLDDKIKKAGKAA